MFLPLLKIPFSEHFPYQQRRNGALFLEGVFDGDAIVDNVVTHVLRIDGVASGGLGRGQHDCVVELQSVFGLDVNGADLDFVGIGNTWVCIVKTAHNVADLHGGVVRLAEERICEFPEHLQGYDAHGLFSGNAIENIEKSALEEVMVTDTIPSRHSCDRIKVVSVSELLAKVIQSVVDDTSISSHYYV